MAQCDSANQFLQSQVRYHNIFDIASSRQNTISSHVIIEIQTSLLLVMYNAITCQIMNIVPPWNLSLTSNTSSAYTLPTNNKREHVYVCNDMSVRVYLSACIYIYIYIYIYMHLETCVCLCAFEIIVICIVGWGATSVHRRITRMPTSLS